MGQVFLEGFLLQASLIFALGAQNIFILESGLKRQHHILVSFICFFCDFAIIMLGVIGTATLLKEYPEVKIVFGILGVGFLVYYGVGKLKANQGTLIISKMSSQKSTFAKSILAAITFSIVNPHAYLDGIVLIGGYSSKFSLLSERVALGSGAAFYSLVWFLFLSITSSSLISFVGNAKRMRYAMSVSGIILIFLSAKLSLDVYDWVIEALEADPSVIVQGE